MARSNELGMQTYDQALYSLYEQSEITYEDAIAHADSPNDLRLMIKLGNETNADRFDGSSNNLRLQD